MPQMSYKSNFFTQFSSLDFYRKMLKYQILVLTSFSIRYIIKLQNNSSLITHSTCNSHSQKPCIYPRFLAVATISEAKQETFLEGMTPMTKTSTPSDQVNVRTHEQEAKFSRLMEDIAKHATRMALNKVKVDREGWQRVLGKGNKIQEEMTDAVLEMIGQCSESCLQCVKSVEVPANGEVIITEQLLREKYNFGWFGDNFRRLFFGRKLNEVSARSIAIHQLKEYCTNQQLKDELGDQAVISFLYALSLVEQQRDGQQGPLLTNGYGNLVIVEIKEKDGKKGFWLVDFDWDSGDRYWVVGANPLGNLGEWGDGYQVLSGDSEIM